MRILRHIAWEIWLPIVLVALWWFASANSTDTYFPPLKDILERSKELWFWEGTRNDILPSLRRLAIGYLISCFAGVLLGLLIGSVRWLENATRPYIEFLRSTPGIALMPLISLVFGLGDSFKIVTIALVCSWPILLNTIDGVQSVEPQLRNVAKSYRLSTTDQVRYILLPSAAPQIFAGARTALAIGVIAMTASEMIGIGGGLGFFTLNASTSFDYTGLWSGIIALGVLGYILNKIFALVERRLIAWHYGLVAHTQGGN
jgi:ABC-type nitrate/sulfonate/bicarbonate transport system permease component